MFKFIASALVATSALTLSAAPVADAEMPATRESVSWLSQADWATDTLSEAGIEVPANVTVTLTDVGNCGADLSAAGMGGCTTHNTDGTITVVVSPGLAGSAWGNHILLHEYAHTLGYGECAAEAYAHVYERSSDLWSYPECEEL